MDYHRSLVGNQMLVRGAARCGSQRGGEPHSPPSSRASGYFSHGRGPPTVIESFDSRGGPVVVGEGRWRESRGNDKLQAREARLRQHDL